MHPLEILLLRFAHARYAGALQVEKYVSLVSCVPGWMNRSEVLGKLLVD